MAVGWQQLLIVLVLVLVLSGGRGRISALMGDMAKGIKSFRSGLKDEDEAEQNEAVRASLASDSAQRVRDTETETTRTKV